MKVFNNKFYIFGFFSLLIMGAVVIYTFRTLFDTLTSAFEVETKIPESELRISRKNLEKAYNFAYESDPTRLNLEEIGGQDILDVNEDDEEVVEETSEEGSG